MKYKRALLSTTMAITLFCGSSLVMQHEAYAYDITNDYPNSSQQTGESNDSAKGNDKSDQSTEQKDQQQTSDQQVNDKGSSTDEGLPSNNQGDDSDYSNEPENPDDTNDSHQTGSQDQSGNGHQTDSSDNNEITDDDKNDQESTDNNQQSTSKNEEKPADKSDTGSKVNNSYKKHADSASKRVSASAGKQSMADQNVVQTPNDQATSAISSADIQSAFANSDASSGSSDDENDPGGWVEQDVPSANTSAKKPTSTFGKVMQNFANLPIFSNFVDGTTNYFHPKETDIGKLINKINLEIENDLTKIPVVGNSFSKIVQTISPLTWFDNVAAGITGFFHIK